MEVDLDITTYMLAAKYSPDIGSDTARPFLTAGLGAIYADFETVLWEATVLEGLLRTSSSDSDLDIGSKIGLGVDYYLREKWSLAVEGNYTLGFGDVDDIKYFTTGLGLAYHF